MPTFLRYTFAGIVLGVLIGVPLTYSLWQREQYRNFHIVHEGVLYRSGQLPLDGLKRIIHDHHIKTVVTLRYPAAADKPAPDADEERMCREQGLHYFRLPYQSWTGREDEGASVPANANVQQFIDIMKDPRNHPVLVHCFAGVHRTGAMCAVYRMEFERWSPEQAMSEMRAMGYSAHHQDVFSYLEKYRPRTRTLDRTNDSLPLIHVAEKDPSREPENRESWAERLFLNGTSKDFGTVVRGTKLMHKFKITNIYKVPLEIVSARNSSGGVTATPETYKLEPGESTDLNVVMDCRRFVGQRAVCIYVIFGPQRSEVKLLVQATVRPDVALDPAKQSAFEILLPNSAPRRYAHLAQPGDVVQVDLGPNQAGLGSRFVVQPDGTVNLGKHGSVRVAGLAHLPLLLEVHSRLGASALELFPGDDRPKTCRVVVKGNAGDQAFTLPWKAGQQVNDAISQVPGQLTNVDGCRAWIIRRSANGKGPSKILAIDWDALRHGETNTTNWRTQTGDEIHVDTTFVQANSSDDRKNPPALPVAVNSSLSRAANEPDEAAILRALKPACRVSYVHEESRSNFDFVVERMRFERDPAVDFFLIGPAQVERTLWKCTVNYTEHVRVLFPLPMRSECRREQVVYIHREVLHPFSSSVSAARPQR